MAPERALLPLAAPLNRRQRAHALPAENAVTRVLLEAATVAEARPGVLEALGETIGCAAAGWWEADPVTGAMRCEASWHSPDLEPDQVRDLGAQAGLGPLPV